MYNNQMVINEIEIEEGINVVKDDTTECVLSTKEDILREREALRGLTKKYYDEEVGYMLQLINDVQVHNETSPAPSTMTISTQSAKCDIIIPELNFMDMALLFGREVTKHIKEKSVLKIGKKSNKTIIQQYISLDREIHGVEHKSVYYGFLNKKRNYFKKQFDNQISVLIGDKGKGKINLKLFKNGSIILVGCKEENVIDGISAIECLKQKIYEYRKYLLKNKMIGGKKFIMTKDENNQQTETMDNGEIIDSMRINNMKITLINCGYSLNYSLERLDLFNILRTEYKLFVSYNPNKYAGVKISYMLNSMNGKKDGICYCENKCKVKDKKKVKGDCLTITVIIFASGEVIITGSKTMNQCYEVYHFINRIMKYNYQKIVKNKLYKELEKYRARKIRMKEVEE